MGCFRQRIVPLLTVLLIFSVSMVSHAATTTITLATYASAAAVAGWDKVLADFMRENPDIEVELQLFPQNEYPTKMMTLMAAGSPPDLILTWAQYKPSWVELNLLTDLTERWENSAVLQSTRFYPFIPESAKSNGRYYGVPHDYNAQIWFTNLDHFAKSGILPPQTDWTVDDMREMARKLVDPVAGVYAVRNPVAGASTELLQWTMNWTGHGWLNEDYTKAMVDSPDVIAMIEYWADMQYNMHAMPGWPGAYPAKGTHLTGGYAMWQGWLSYARTYTANNQFSYDWGVALMPKAPKGRLSLAQGHMFSIPHGANRPEEAWRLAEWLGSYAGQRSLALNLDRQPLGPYTDLWSELYQVLGPKARYIENFVNTALYGPNMVNTMSYWITYPEVNSIMAAAMRSIFTSQAPVANTLISANQQIQALVNQYLDNR
ncbi:MAG TPA: sugar ABC transporter substrate-binding protein [Firmicutes bacterium]|nr:sugar ABC transporter substrate-binding protein [Bacillota bacterium]